jgi:heme-degrading monooxygenase HmoA
MYLIKISNVAIALGFSPFSIMNSITTLSFFRFQSVKPKIWALKQMRYAHEHLGQVAGLQFYKLMGSGRDLGFSPFPDWGVYAILCIWNDEPSATHFFAHSEVYAGYQAQSSERWTIFMKPLQAKGLWSGGNPFTPSTDINASNSLIAVITRATIRPRKLLQFWHYVPRSQRPIQRGCKGLIFTKGIGEIPIVQMSTFSLWETLDDLKNFAYNSPEHLEAVRRTRKLNWYKEELFVRFQPYRSVGTWEGRDPLAPYLNVSKER